MFGRGLAGTAGAATLTAHAPSTVVPASARDVAGDGHNPRADERAAVAVSALGSALLVPDVGGGAGGPNARAPPRHGERAGLRRFGAKFRQGADRYALSVAQATTCRRARCLQPWSLSCLSLTCRTAPERVRITSTGAPCVGSASPAYRRHSSARSWVHLTDHRWIGAMLGGVVGERRGWSMEGKPARPPHQETRPVGIGSACVRWARGLDVGPSDDPKNEKRTTRRMVLFRGWCARGDSNPHSISATSTSNLRVYQVPPPAHIHEAPDN
jgi:hypothetical protein